MTAAITPRSGASILIGDGGATMKRNSDAGWIAGVAAGLAPDSVLAAMLLRAAFVFVPGAFVLYFVLWAVLPDES